MNRTPAREANPREPTQPFPSDRGSDVSYEKAIRVLHSTGLTQRPAPPLDIVTTPFDKAPIAAQPRRQWDFRILKLGRMNGRRAEQAQLAISLWREATRNNIDRLELGGTIDANSIAWLTHVAGSEGARLEAIDRAHWAGQLYCDLLKSAIQLGQSAESEHSVLALAMECQLLHEICEWSEHKSNTSESIESVRQQLIQLFDRAPLGTHASEGYALQCQALRCITLTVLLTTAFYRKTGYFPSKVTTAASEFDAELPVDPYSQSGQPIRYRLASGQKLRGIIGYRCRSTVRTRVGQPLVYSVASNGRDDNGGEAWKRGDDDGDWIYPIRRDRGKRKWLQFNLKTLLPLMAIVAIYLASTQSESVRRERALEAVRRFGMAETSFDDAAAGWWMETKARVLVNRVELDSPDAWVIQELRNLPEIEAIDLDGLITADGIKTIARLPNLKTLDLEDANVPIDAIPLLANLSNLEELNLTGLPITDAQLHPLHKCPRLNTLNLNETNVTGTGFSTFVDSPMETLTVLGSPISSAGMVQIGRLTNLVHLDLDSTPIDGDSLQHLARLTQLESLDMRNNQYGSRGLTMLPRLPKLTTLYLLSVPLKKADLERVAATCPSLAELDLDGCNIDDESLKPLAELKSLKDLDVSNNTRVTATGIAYLKQRMDLSTLDTDNADVSEFDVIQLLWQYLSDRLNSGN